MTTHETQPETMDQTQAQPAHAAPEAQVEPPPVEQDVQPAPMEHAQPTQLDSAAELNAPGVDAETDSSTTDLAARHDDDQMLFGDSEMSDLRSRWTEVQSAFVDDPRDCVQKADGLVSDVVDKLTAGFAQARSGLEEQWSRGEEASTEDLRIALKRYREFFERLLAV